MSLRELDELGRGRSPARAPPPRSSATTPASPPTPFPASLCLSVNEVIVHGIPDRTRLRAGDILVDRLRGGGRRLPRRRGRDRPVGEIDPAAGRLLETTERALWAGISEARVGNRLSDISHAVGQVAREAGYGILADHGGHGVGQLLHEDPSVDNDGRLGRGPLCATGWFWPSSRCSWTATRPTPTVPTAGRWRPRRLRRPTFEHTVAVLDEGPEPLTVR